MTAKKTKKTVRKSKPSTTKPPQTVLLLRTCRADLKCCAGDGDHRPFQWPESGPVECPDWDPTPDCGHGLHGLRWGAGDAKLLRDKDGKWLVFEALASEVIDIGPEKSKARRGNVVYCGEQKGALDFLLARLPPKLAALI